LQTLFKLRTKSVTSSIQNALPPVVPFRLRVVTGSDYYGAFQEAAAYCGLRRVPYLSPRAWQHGSVPPWQQVQPEMIISCAPQKVQCLVARRDEETYLRQAGFEQVRAIGLPIVYTNPSGVKRIPNSILIMPMHCIPGDNRATDNSDYVNEVERATRGFDRRAVCVSGRCMANGLWVSQFQRAGVEVIHGASVNDANALRRMRALFETFEFMTTGTYGSHVPYALYFGARISLWGPSRALTREYLLRDELWSRFPDAVDQLLSQESVEKAEKLLGRFRVEPQRGIADQDFGGWMVGAENRLSSSDLRKAFGWDLVARGRGMFQDVRDQLALRTRWKRLLTRTNSNYVNDRQRQSDSERTHRGNTSKELC